MESMVIPCLTQFPICTVQNCTYQTLWCNPELVERTPLWTKKDAWLCVKIPMESPGVQIKKMIKYVGFMDVHPQKKHGQLEVLSFNHFQSIPWDMLQVQTKRPSDVETPALNSCLARLEPCASHVACRPWWLPGGWDVTFRWTWAVYLADRGDLYLVSYLHRNLQRFKIFHHPNIIYIIISPI